MWIIVVLVALLYIHLFNAIAKWYLESNRTLTLRDLWRRFFPPIDFHIQL